MPREHVDMLKRYWELLDQTGMDYDLSDFLSEDNLEKAIELMEDKLDEKV